MNIHIANEAELIASYRKHLMHEAKRLIADSPDKVGKMFARVTFPQIRHNTIYNDNDLPKVDFV